MSSKAKLGILLLAVAGLAGQCDSTVNNGSVQVATTVRVSVRADGTEANGPNFFFAFSGDGNIAAFTSQATNLHPDDTDFFRDIFVKDLRTGALTLASRATGVAGAKANGDCERVSISSEGRYLAFASSATNLHPDDSDTISDVFVRDLVNNTTTLVSRATGSAGAKANTGSFTPVISGKAQIVVFRSQADNLDPDDPDTTEDIYVRDLISNTTTLVSRADGATGAKGDNQSQHPSISDDGTVVAFETLSTNMAPGDTDLLWDIYVRDVAGSTTRLISRATGAAGAKGDLESHFAAISGNAQFVSFQSEAENLLGPGNDSNGVIDIFRRDVLNDVTIRVSVSSAGSEASNDSGIRQFPTPFLGGPSSISRSGRYVAFSSLAGNLALGDNNLKGDVFVRDVDAGVTVRASVRTYGAEVNGDCIFPIIQADGQFVGFFSEATNIVDQDNNGVFDVFLRGPLF